MTQASELRLKFKYAYKKGLREYIKEIFRNYPFTEALELTAAERETCKMILTESRINRMCIETSKYAGMYNL